MHVLVTGGAGFLGQHLCRALATRGHVVRVFDKFKNNEHESVIGDIRDAAVVAEALDGIESVFHLASLIEAGESVEKPALYMDNNVLGSIVLMEEMRKLGVKRYLFSSSAAVYGEPLRVPILEDDRTLPINPYGVTKLAMEGLASSYAASHQFSCVALRYFNLYGPGERHQPETHAIPRFVRQLHFGEPISVWGSGEHQRDFVYIHDIVEAHIRALETFVDPGFFYMNLSGKNATKIVDLIHLIAEIMGKEARLDHQDPRPGDPLLLFADGSKAKKLLGWESTTALRDGLQVTIEDLVASFVSEQKV